VCGCGGVVWVCVGGGCVCVGERERERETAYALLLSNIFFFNFMVTRLTLFNVILNFYLQIFLVQIEQGDQFG
jgi:hypothetical protein